MNGDSKYRDDRELIEACLKQKRDAQRILYERFAPRMFPICLRYAPTADEAQDILQNGFVTVFTKLGSYKGEGSFEGWMRRIFVTAALMYLRRNDALKFVDDKEAGESIEAGGVSEDVASKMHTDDLMSIIASLPAGFRTVLNLYAVEGYSHKEIAAMLGIEEASSRSQLSRAKALLQARLKQYYD